MTNMG